MGFNGLIVHSTRGSFLPLPRKPHRSHPQPTTRKSAFRHAQDVFDGRLMQAGV